jgi:hypothetical protein
VGVGIAAAVSVADVVTVGARVGAEVRIGWAVAVGDGVGDDAFAQLVININARIAPRIEMLVRPLFHIMLPPFVAWCVTFLHSNHPAGSSNASAIPAFVESKICAAMQAGYTICL